MPKAWRNSAITDSNHRQGKFAFVVGGLRTFNCTYLIAVEGIRIVRIDLAATGVDADPVISSYYDLLPE